jgi:sporulation protein YlmC with PRC-barrel domain
MKRLLHLELLVGKKVFALNGQSIGRLEEIRAKKDRGHFFVEEFLVGSYAVLERLAAWKGSEGYQVRWDQLDLSDPQRPRLRCEVDELMLLKQGNDE